MNRIRSEAEANWCLQDTAKIVQPSWQKRGIIRQYKKLTLLQKIILWFK